MNPLTILQITIPVIEQLPSVLVGIEALVSAIQTAIRLGASFDEAMSAVKQSLPALTAAIIANTPHASVPPQIPA
jgi:hypothetical protein